MRLGSRHLSPHDAIEVAEILRGIRRGWKRPPAQKAPAIDAEVKRRVDTIEPQTVQVSLTIVFDGISPSCDQLR